MEKLLPLDQNPQPAASEPKRILYAGDDPHVLEPLARMASAAPDEWHIAFRATGQDALRELQNHGFDVILVDLNLPNESAFELLLEVLSRYPSTVRIALCPGVGRSVAVRGGGAAHQYVKKPCDPAALRATLETASRIHQMLVSPKLQAVISRMTSLPSLPSTYARLIESLEDPEISSRELGEIISQDIGLTSKILQIANSAFFGLYRYVANPTEAAVYLGVDTIRAMTLSAGVFSAFQHTGLTRVFIEQLQRHSMTVGVVASQIGLAENLSKRTCDTSLVGGLLHDIGKLVLAADYPKEYGDIMAAAGQGGIAGHETEKHTFGANHSEIGGYLLWLWGFPDSVCNAVAYHHHPAASSPRALSAAGCIHIADALYHEADESPRFGNRVEMDSAYLTSLEILDHLPEWRSIFARNSRTSEQVVK
ncbi:MAG TPA: response regulator [Bryobacteraceae bacterium]|nr:response regulator [Bryobacteraceae bacterium]